MQGYVKYRITCTHLYFQCATRPAFAKSTSGVLWLLIAQKCPSAHSMVIGSDMRQPPHNNYTISCNIKVQYSAKSNYMTHTYAFLS